MFTGITSAIGTIRSAEQRGDLRIVIDTDMAVDDAALGASIACSGCCLTVIERGPGWFAVDASAETVTCTAKGRWSVGTRLNLERALRLGDELGGHIVTGHVDGVGRIEHVDIVGDSHRVTVRVERGVAPFIAAKGSVTVDGVSLTVNAVDDSSDGSATFALNIIPHTWAVTTFGSWQAGDEVNIEIDVLARYLARMREATGSA
jgi:riboflavin synthase